MEAYDSLASIQQAILEKRLTCIQLVSQYLHKIQTQTHLNIFLEVFDTEALARAEAIDQKFQQGTQGKLAGMVIGLKDVICYQNHSLEAASKILGGFQSQFNGTAVERLLAEDAIIIGRQNCDEFAMGSSNENSAYGATLNPVDETRVPGGSSGASAAAVKADLCLASIGSDTGGSVRQPAAFCGVVGLKATYGRISRHGLIAYASSFDGIGILSKNATDAALLLEVMAGADEWDSTVSRRPVPAYSQQLQLEGKLRIAYLKETLTEEGLAEEIKQKTLARLDWLQAQGYQVTPVDFPLLAYILPIYYILTTAEASSNLARYDGVRYGFRSDTLQERNYAKINQLESMYKETRSQGFGAEVKRRIMLGTFVLSADYYDAYYLKAQKARKLVKEQTDKILADHDLIVSPTTPRTAFRLGELTQDPLEMYLEDLFTVQANVTGLPAISVPNGQDQDGLPIGFQIMARPFEENKLLAFSQYLLDNH